MTEKELRRLLGKEYDSAIKETMSTLTLPITKEKLIAALLKANKLYWVRRLSQIDTFFTADAEACAAALAVPYIAASKTFTDRVKSIYTAYESAFDLSHEDAKELLDKVVYDRSIAESLRKIADDMPDGKEKTRILAEISAPAYRYRLERAEAMCKQAQEVCDEIAVGEVSAVREFLQTETERAYNLTVEGLTEPTPADTIIESIAPEPIQLRFNEMPKASEPVRELTPTPVQTGVHDSFTLVSEKNVREIVEHDWNGREFSKSIWNHTDDLAKEIKQVLIEGELTGASEVDMAAKIAERFDVAMGRARCVVRTESNYCTNQAELKALKGAGIEFYEYAALHDERTSEICDALNGKTFPLKDAVVGVNYPPMHPNCRSSVMPVLETEDDLDRELEEMMRQAGAPEGMTFDEFVEHLIPSENGERLIFDPNRKYDDDFKPVASIKTEPKAEQNEGNTAEPVDNSEKSGIIKENNSGRKATPPRSSVSNDVSLPLGSNSFSEREQKHLYKHERIISQKNYETAILYNKNGKRVLTKSGEADKVIFSAKEIKEMNGCVLTHNHPNCSIFSPNDINILRRGKLAEMRACNKYGTYVMQFSGKWPTDISNFSKIQKEYYNLYSSIGKEYRDIAAKEGKSIVAYLDEIDRKFMQKFCDRFGITFRWEAL